MSCSKRQTLRKYAANVPAQSPPIPRLIADYTGYR